MSLQDTIAVMTIYDDAVPCNQGADYLPIGQNVFFKQTVFFLSERRNLIGKFRIDN